MSIEALNRIIKKVNALTPQERRELIDRLTHEQNSHEQDDQDLRTSKPITTDATTLREWLTEARNMRVELPLTSNSVDILRELRHVRSKGNRQNHVFGIEERD